MTQEVGTIIRAYENGAMDAAGTIEDLVEHAQSLSDRIDVLVEKAWHEGWSSGYRSGTVDGGSDSCWSDETGDWEKSDARGSLRITHRDI